jgi:hypothetical protein
VLCVQHGGRNVRLDAGKVDSGETAWEGRRRKGRKNN